MTRDELLELIAEVQRHQSELTGVEVKSARGGTPLISVREALSAFANRTGGGVLLFGVDEGAGFGVVGVGDAQRLQEEIGHLAANDMVPALRPEFTVAEIDGKTVVAVEVAEVPAIQKPCYYRPAQLQGGSFIRVGLSNRHMTDYEIFGYVSARSQPRFDAAPVPQATLDDLDRDRLVAFLTRLRQNRPRAVFPDLPFEQVLAQLRVLVRDEDGILRPTLAGLLTFGTYPQAFESQLVITFLQYYGTDPAEPTPRGERFMDNQKFEGPVVEVIEAAVNHVLASIRKSSLIDGLFRRDIPEYPEEAIREAVVNAVAHRDYSHYARGTYVQIRLFADRLEIQSPGGLYGVVTEETLGDLSSTRNQELVRFLEDLRLVENRGSGIRAMIGAMRRANLEPPIFRDHRTFFQVTFRNHTLMSPDTITWLNRFAALRLNDHQRVALACLRHNDQITNSDYRRLNTVDGWTATGDLRGLVQARLVEQHSTGGGAYYTLAVPGDIEQPEPFTDQERVLAFVREHGSIDNARCRRLLGVDVEQARRLLTRLVRQGLLRREGERRWAIYYAA